MISKETDMKWTQFDIENVETVGKAPLFIYWRCILKRGNFAEDYRKFRKFIKWIKPVSFTAFYLYLLIVSAFSMVLISELLGHFSGEYVFWRQLSIGSILVLSLAWSLYRVGKELFRTWADFR
jgi:hypothetical protein